jgi:hypothetical protein
VKLSGAFYVHPVPDPARRLVGVPRITGKSFRCRTRHPTASFGKIADLRQRDAQTVGDVKIHVRTGEHVGDQRPRLHASIPRAEIAGERGLGAPSALRAVAGGDRGQSLFALALLPLVIERLRQIVAGDVDPLMQPLRSDPAFQEFMKQLGSRFDANRARFGG